MPRKTVDAAWGATPAFIAVSDTVILLRNTTSNFLFYEITADEFAPVFTENLGFFVPPMPAPDSQTSLTLKAGERFWLAMPTGSDDVTMTTAPA